MSLLSDLQAQVKRLSDDLRERSEQEPFASALRAEHTAAATPPEPERPRTAVGFAAWREDRITQAAVAWVLSTVFVRFCEDNDLVELPWISGPGDRLDLAIERAEQRARSHPDQTDRDWLEVAFEGLSSSPVAAGLFDRAHNPLWTITPSHEGAKELLAFWRRRDGEGSPIHDLTHWDTRNLGQLYQELSQHAKETYALLQTPEFVETFILDITLDPAIDEFGLEGLRVIDPACGSGHFLIGVFKRLLGRWRKKAPDVNDWVLIRRALDSIHGVDKNPFAAAIARFRLMIEAMRAGGIKRLDAPATFPLHIAVGDSLLHGRDAPGMQDTLTGQHHYVTEDVEDYIKSVDILGRNSYHVVVGNPPYITVKDKAENENYRRGYKTCAGTYALSVPFAERFFNLAKRAHGDRKGAGYVGQITANSFMKREFGKKLIVDFGQNVELTRIIDTSGAFIPGHGTPTVILVGRNKMPQESLPVVAVLGVRGEPTQPDDPAKGHVWQAITDQYNKPGSESEWVTVTDLDRASLREHPWSLSGGGAAAVVEQIERGPDSLADCIDVIGRTTQTSLDDAFFLPMPSVQTRHLAEACIPLVMGKDIRDYGLTAPTHTYFPYSKHGMPREIDEVEAAFLWPNRTCLRERLDFGQHPEERGLRWFDHSMFFASRYRTPLSIAFAFVSTHNHFVLDRGGKVFKQSAPVIKLPQDASEDDYLALLGILNSSSACFWLKQVSQPKAGTDNSSGGGNRWSPEPWMERYEFTGGNLERFPLPDSLPVELGRRLDALAQELAQTEPAAVCAKGMPTRERLDAARMAHEGLRTQMIAWQEELDWDCYRRYRLLTETEAAGLLADPKFLPDLRLGERAFEIALARAVTAASEPETVWFARHGSTRITEIPAHWPPAYRDVVQRRVEALERRRDLAIVERPEFKRRWQSEPWEEREREALQAWLLDQCEARELWFRMRDGERVPRLLTVNQLADALRSDADVVGVAQLFAGHLDMRDADLAAILKAVVADEHVPYLAALRYKDSGLRKRDEWESVWAMQRKEDRAGQRLEIPVPQKYTSADFAKPSYWRNRGKLDVSKERFISYPEANPDGDGSLLLGWAGWNHAEQADALAALITERTENDSWPTERIVPLLAGLAEVMPWVQQWHDTDDRGWGTSPAEDFKAFLDDQRQRHGLTEEDLQRWRPTAGWGGGRGKRT